MIDIEQIQKDTTFSSTEMETRYTVTYSDAANIIWEGIIRDKHIRRVSRISRKGAANFLNNHKYAVAPK